MDYTAERKPMTTIRAREQWAPPEWATLQRLIIDTLNEATLEFIDRFTRSDRTLIWRDRWAGMDGSDDPYEGFMNFPLFYALGGSEEVHKVSREIWDAITWQWTQYGQIHNEFDAYYDWMHHGEGYLFFYFFGLANPNVFKDRQRAYKFARFYTGEDPDVPNYDTERRLIRSPITGSRGPRYHQTAEDWETHREILDNYLPPFEDIPGIDGNGTVCPWSDDVVYSEILNRINERWARGDVPLNLNATSLVTHAYMYGAEDNFKKWVLEYVDAWGERTRRNNGIIPDNVGLSDVIGEYNNRKWWGGYYGWRWPHGAMTILEPLINGFSNAVLLTGNFDYLNLVRSQLDMLWSLRKNVNGKWLVPNRHCDDGWRDYRAPHPIYGVYLWNISMQEEDAARVERDWSELFDSLNSGNAAYGPGTIGESLGFNVNTAQWFRYIRGHDPDYPVKILKLNYETIRSQLEKLRLPENDPHVFDHYQESMTIHQWQSLTPMIIEGLAQLTLGGPMHVYHGGLQHTRVRYYDAKLKRPGLPPAVAALVEALTNDSVTLNLVNLSLIEAAEVIIQAGAFGEHNFHNAHLTGFSNESTPVNGKWCLVQLDPGTGIKLKLKMGRYENRPSYETPWNVQEDKTKIIYGREIE